MPESDYERKRSYKQVESIIKFHYLFFSTLFLTASYAILQSGHIATERFMSKSVFAYNFAISIVSFRYANGETATCLCQQNLKM